MDNFTETLQHFLPTIRALASDCRVFKRRERMPSIDTNVSVIHSGDAAFRSLHSPPIIPMSQDEFTFTKKKFFRDWISRSTLYNIPTLDWNTTTRDCDEVRCSTFFFWWAECNPTNNLFYRQHCVKSSVKLNSQSNKFYAFSTHSTSCDFSKRMPRGKTRSNKINTLWLLVKPREDSAPTYVCMCLVHLQKTIKCFRRFHATSSPPQPKIFSLYWHFLGEMWANVRSFVAIRASFFRLLARSCCDALM